MATSFSKFELLNQNNISIQLTLEAPLGATSKTVTVGAGETFYFQPNLDDISSVRIVVDAGHEHHDVQTFERTGSPFHMFFETLKARTSIGSIHGVVSAAF